MLLQPGDIALLPELEEVVVERRRPGDAAFEEADIEGREAARDAAQEHGAAKMLAADAETAEPIIDEIIVGLAALGLLRARMSRRRHLEIDAALPDGIVIPGAVDTQRMDLGRETREMRRIGQHLRMRPPHLAGDGDR